MKKFKKCIWLLVRFNRHKNVISPRVHTNVTHGMVLKTRFIANIQYWTCQNPEKAVRFR